MTRLDQIAILACAALLAGCGSKGATVDSAQAAPYVASSSAASSAGGASSLTGASTPSCVTTADVKSALGFDVRELTKGMKRYGPMMSCGFEASDYDALPGVTIQLVIEPGSEAEKRFADMRGTVTTARGQPTEPDPIPLGERGMAYRTSSRTMASALSKGQLYSVDLRYGAVSKFGDKEAGVVALLKKLMGS